MQQKNLKRNPFAHFTALRAVGLLWLALAPLLMVINAGGAAPPAFGSLSVPANTQHATRNTQVEADTSILYSSAPDYPDAGLQALVESYVNDAPGDWAVTVKKLSTGQYAAVNGDKQTVTASLYKLFVLYQVMRQRDLGTLSLDDTMVITAANAAYDLKLGDLRWTVGDRVAISKLLRAMITVSDNTAALTLANGIGLDPINASLQRLGLPNSKLDFSDDGDNMTTANEYNRLLEWIATGQVLSRDSCRYMIDLLLDQQINDQLPVGVPAEVPVAHKNGTLANPYRYHDAGIIYAPSGAYAISVLSWGFDDFAVSRAVTGKLSRAVYNYFNTRPSAPARYFPETGQVVGPEFLLYYNTHGGRPILGLPIAPETKQGDKIVQWFERVRLERPAAGGPVGLGAVGRELLAAQGRTFPPVGKPAATDPNTLWFAGTQQALGQPFLDYWRAHGSDDLFGPPLSDVIVEQRADGPHRVQYFERARFELQPDGVWLGLVGQELYSLQH